MDPTVPDPFTQCTNLETTHIHEGYTDGYKTGLNLGHTDGHLVGLKQGFKFGEEVGFYKGLVSIWAKAITLDPTCFSERVKKSVQQMKEMVESMHVGDPEDESKDDVLESVRRKFKAVCATLGVKLEYDGFPNLGGAQNTEF